MEAKKQGVGEEDLSMEEILQSIRRIIADDDEGGKDKSANSTTTNGAGANRVGDIADAASNILELTDMIEDDGSITNLKENATKADTTIDVLKNIDAALVPEIPAAPTLASKEEKPEVVVPEVKTATPATSAPETKNVAEISNNEIDSLLSKTAEAATVSALSKLKIPDDKPMQPTTPSPEFRSGSTVEDLVEELLKPMMKDWLDNNLPAIVERIVEREVLRLTRR